MGQDPIAHQGDGVAGTTAVYQACAVCGCTDYRHTEVLWQGLIDEWGLSSEEAAYVNRQQGTQCVRCSSNLRSIALAKAICRSQGFDGTLDELIASAPSFGLLEVNDAGTLHGRLSQFSGHRFASYPEYDLMALALPDGALDMVIHSDTLEHVPDPMRALLEMRRVLIPRGCAVFTVPIVIGRLSRSREGLAPSYHGNPSEPTSDLMVHTEYGADAWVDVLRAGFSSCELVPFGFPAGIALIARV